MVSCPVRVGLGSVSEIPALSQLALNNFPSYEVVSFENSSQLNDTFPKENENHPYSIISFFTVSHSLSGNLCQISVSLGFKVIGSIASPSVL
jgi:hypothetical protein